MKKRVVGSLCILVGLCSAQASGVTYSISTIAGSSSIGDSGLATAAQIGNIQGITVDRLGNLYLSDTDHGRIRKIDTHGVITTIAGTGVAAFSGDGGPAASATLNLPYGLAADLNGNIYIADLGNQRVRRIATDGTISTVAGTGVKGSLGDGGLATNAQLMSPRNVAVDAVGNLYISEFEGHRIRMVNSGGKISTVAGTGVAGFRGDGSLAVNSQIGYPAGLTVDRSGALYLADSANGRVRKIIPGGVISTVAGGTTTQTLTTPVAVAIDAYNNLYIADASYIVHEASASGAWTSVSGSGAPAFSGDGGQASKAQLTAPHDITIDLNGNVDIADGIRIRQINSQGVISTIAGDGFLNSVGDGNIATLGILNQPMGVALDRLGNLYIADTGTQRVRMVTSAGKLATLAGTGVTGFNGDQIPAGTATLYSPMGVATDVYGDVFIADTYNHRIREVGASGKIATFAGTGSSGQGAQDLLPLQTQLRGPRNICNAVNGTVYIVDTSNHRVLMIAPGGYAATVAGNGTAGLGGDGGPALTAELNMPGACAVDSTGNLFIADTANHRIAKVDTKGIITTVAGTGTAGTSADGTTATAAALSSPAGVAVDDGGDIFISDTGNSLIRQVTPDGAIHTIAGNAMAGFSGDGGPALSASISAPAGIVMDGSGALYFADTGNNRVRILARQTTPPPTTTPVTIPQVTAVNGASLLPGSIAPGEIITLYGSSIGPAQGVAGTLNASGLLSNLIAGTEVRFDGVAAPLYYAQAGQVNVQAPYTISGQATTHVEVIYQGQTAGQADLTVTPTAPAMFPTVLNQDNSLNGINAPALQGTILTFFATGEGMTTGSNIAGQPAASPYPQPAANVSLTIGGSAATLTYAGEAPGLVGLLQIDAVVPAGLPSGASNAILTVGGVAAPATAIWMQ